MTDGEELGDEDVDYDDVSIRLVVGARAHPVLQVLAIIDRKKLRNGGRDRARSNARRRAKNAEGESEGMISTDGSYASLDKLPETALGLQQDSTEGLHQRKPTARRHSRGESLEGNVPLDQLRAAAGRRSGTFEEVTADLNKEVEEKWKKVGKAK